MNSNYGTLYIVATPIGNLSDMTGRAEETLKKVDLIAAEDTRVTGLLLNKLGISKPLWAVHDHNESQQSEALIERLKSGQSIALVSDAGTPLISDPGYAVVVRVRAEGLSVVPIPGVSAVITALSVCGLPTDRFTFNGFLPAKSKAKAQMLVDYCSDSATQVFYESTHRLLDTLQVMLGLWGDQRQISLAKELTKIHESIVTGSVSDVLNWLSEDVARVKGEFVLMVEGAKVGESSSELTDEDQALMGVLLKYLSVKDASQAAADITGKKKKPFYQWGLSQN